MTQTDKNNSKGSIDQNELKLINKRVVFCYAILVMVLSISYVIEIVKQAMELNK